MTDTEASKVAESKENVSVKETVMETDVVTAEEISKQEAELLDDVEMKTDEAAKEPENEEKENTVNGGNEHQEGDEPLPVVDIEELYAKHGGDPSKLALDRCVLVSNLPSVFLDDSFKIFEESLIEMLISDFKIPREQIESVVRVPKLQQDASDEENALSAVVCIKSKVHKHRMIAQKKVDDKSSLALSTLEEIPKDWFEGELLEMADEVGGEDENNENEKKKDEKSEIKESDEEARKQREKEEREAYVARHKEDDEEDIPFKVEWDGAPEFQWKICAGKIDSRKVFLENVSLADLNDPFLYRAIVKAENIEMEFPGRFSHDGSKQHLGKVTLTFRYEQQVMPAAMRSLIYVRASEKRRVKIFLPQTSSNSKLKDAFEARLGRVLTRTDVMRQCVVKVLPEGFEPTKEAAESWFNGTPVESVELKIDARGQRCALVTFPTVRECMTAHAMSSIILVGETKCKVFLMSIEVNKDLMSPFDRIEERDLFKKKWKEEKEKSFTRPSDRKHPKFESRKRRPDTKETESSSAKKERPSTTSGTSATKTFPSKTRGGAPPSSRGPPPPSSSRGRPGASGNYPLRGRGTTSRPPRGSRGGYRGAASRPPPLTTPSSRTVGKGAFDGPSRYSDRPAPFSDYGMEKKLRAERDQIELREQILRQQQMIDSLSNRLRDPGTRSAFDSTAAGGYSSGSFGGAGVGAFDNKTALSSLAGYGADSAAGAVFPSSSAFGASGGSGSSGFPSVNDYSSGYGYGSSGDKHGHNSYNRY